jgi:hypothetical protein
VTGWLRLAALAAALLPAIAGGAAAQAPEERAEALLSQVRSRSGGVLGIMGYNMTPDGSSNAVQINRTDAAGDREGSPTFTLGQLGAGFTLSESFPLWLEGYLGTARYDPRAVFTDLGARRAPLRWNNISTTVGIGYDIRLGEYFWLRPILNLAAGYAASDASLFGSFLSFRTDREFPGLTDRHVNVWGAGGSLMLAYYDYRPARDIDVELRYTQLRLQTFGDTVPAARGGLDAKTIGLWARYRWPSGLEAFGRPVRWVLEGNLTGYIGDQAEIMGFNWATKVGGGVEVDVGRYEIGALGLSLSRIRLITRYFFADHNVTGVSIGLGVSF